MQGTCIAFAVVIFASVFVDPPQHSYVEVMWLFLGGCGGAIMGAADKWIEYHDNRDLERHDG